MSRNRKKRASEKAKKNFAIDQEKITNILDSVPPEEVIKIIEQGVYPRFVDFARLEFSRRKRKRGSVFISHSTRDLEKLVKPVAKKLQAAGFEAYVASLRMSGKNPAEKILEAIRSCKALFAIITPNVTEDKDTRDYVLFELGAAKSLGKRVYGWKTPDLMVPEPVKQITDYVTFDPAKHNEVKQMLQMVSSAANNL